MFLGDFYFELPTTFPTLVTTSVYFILFTFIVFVLSRTYKSILRPFILLVANLVFLWSFSLYNLIAIILITLVSYGFGIIIDKKKDKFILYSFVGVYVLLLSYFKYAGLFISDSLIMPLGLSFYTFKIMSYLFDVYKEKIEVERNILYFTVYVTFFPTLIAGPINRAQDFLQTIKSKPKFDYKEAKGGALQMLLGIFEKLVFVDYIAIVVNTIFGNEELMGINILLGIILYSFQIYLDFDALSNIAIGTARLLGFKIPKNFNSPYLASNLQEFWHRWHISLSTWFKDYLYIPLGGSRKGQLRKYINIIIVFLVSGIWHGSTWNFVIWGLLHGIIQMLEDIVLKPFRGKEVNKILRYSLKLFGIIFNFIIVSFLWLIFKYQTMGEVFNILNKLFTSQSLNFDLIGLVPNEVYWLGIILIIVIVLDIIRNYTNMINVFNNFYFPIRWAFYVLFIGVFIIFGVYGGSFEASDFIYQFF